MNVGAVERKMTHNVDAPRVSGRGRGSVAVESAGIRILVGDVSKGRGRGIVHSNNISIPVVPMAKGRPKAVPVNAVANFIQASSIDLLELNFLSNLPTINFISVADYFQKMREQLRHTKDNV